MKLGSLFKELKVTFLKGCSITIDLVKIMFPVLILAKILEAIGGITLLGKGLEPLMALVGLPGDMGLVWATSMITNVYGGIAIFFTLLQGNDAPVITVAQTTVLMSMILIVHNLPVEQKIVSKTGLKIIPMTLFRISFGFFYGWILYYIYQWLDVFQTPLTHHLLQSAIQQNFDFFQDSFLNEITVWVYQTVRLFFSIFLIIMGLVFFLKLLEVIKIYDWLLKVLTIVLYPFKIEKRMNSLIMIGAFLGIAYGGGLIINETKVKSLNKKDIFLVMSLLSLSHGLIEDTLIVYAVGADLSGIFWGRILFTGLVLLGLSQVVHRIKGKGEKFFKWIYQ